MTLFNHKNSNKVNLKKIINYFNLNFQKLYFMLIINLILIKIIY